MSRIKHTPEEKILITKAVLSGESNVPVLQLPIWRPMRLYSEHILIGMLIWRLDLMSFEM